MTGHSLLSIIAACLISGIFIGLGLRDSFCQTKDESRLVRDRERACQAIGFAADHVPYHLVRELRWALGWVGRR